MNKVSDTMTRAALVKQWGKAVMEFDDNTLLSGLYGHHDVHLVRIEQLLNVKIASRGNRLVIEGDDDDCAAAKAIVSRLYDDLKDGRDVDLQGVDAAIRMVSPDVLIMEKAEKRDRDSTPEKALRSAALEIRTRKRTISPRSPMQADFMAKLLREDLVFGVGPAGTGKTYLAVARAVSRMLSGDIDRIILSRPAVEAGENLGFLPGDLKEKVDPYLRPLYDALYDMLPEAMVERKLESGQIEIAPLAFMRGRTLSNAFIILDEAQNTTALQMKMFLTRFGENAQMAVVGDPYQIDLPTGQQSGLIHALDILKESEGVAITRFTSKDVVRHPLVARIVEAYQKHPPASHSDGSASRRPRRDES